MIGSSSASRRHWSHYLLRCLLVAALTAGTLARAGSDPRAARFTLKHRSIPASDYAEFASVVERALSAGQLTFLLHR